MVWNFELLILTVHSFVGKTKVESKWFTNLNLVWRHGGFDLTNHLWKWQSGSQVHSVPEQGETMKMIFYRTNQHWMSRGLGKLEIDVS